jgi:hypothetical protein
LVLPDVKWTLVPAVGACFVYAIFHSVLSKRFCLGLLKSYT